MIFFFFRMVLGLSHGLTLDKFHYLCGSVFSFIKFGDTNLPGNSSTAARGWGNQDTLNTGHESRKLPWG
jgi:hypothetical protein